MSKIAANRSPKQSPQPANEFQFIEQIRSLITSVQSNAAIRLGIGDDCALLAKSATQSYAVTCDTQIEGVHFKLNWFDRLGGAYALGLRAMAVNLSDLAAMGATPVAAFISLALPATFSQSQRDHLYQGIFDAITAAGGTIAGGNLAAARDITIDIFLIGTVETKRALLRSNAKPGDRIFITGTIGGAAAGLHILQSNRARFSQTQREIAQQWTQPEPRLAFAAQLLKQRVSRSAIDISDGVLQDLSHVCKASQCGARINLEALPLGAGCTSWADAMTSGEEYELLFTVPANVRESTLQQISNSTGTRVSCIGILTETSEIELLHNGIKQTIPHSRTGWDHFKRKR